jgi:hypothetical protein
LNYKVVLKLVLKTFLFEDADEDCAEADLDDVDDAFGVGFGSGGTSSAAVGL